MIRLIDLPGIARLEERVFLYGAEEGFRRLLVRTCVNLFGAFVLTDTEENADAYGYYGLPNGVEEGTQLRWQLLDGATMLDDDDLADWDDGEPFPRSPGLHMAEDLVEYLLTFGLDLRKSNGQPLEITQAISLTVECAVRALHGCKMPDMENAAAETFGLGMEHQAHNWKAHHRDTSPSSPRSASAVAEALFKKG